MPDAWSPKDDRQYKHILDSERQQGRSEAEAEEIAARTVNKRRRQEGRTPNTRTQGTGNPNTPLTELPRGELYNRAREQAIQGRSSMSRAQLIAALSKTQTG